MASDNRTILLAEDDPNDAFFLQYAFQEAGITNPIKTVNDGQQAIDYLSSQGAYADRGKFPFPCLVLLDLKLPVKMGFEVLRWLQKQPQLQNVLVLVLTSSSNLSDVDESIDSARAHFWSSRFRPKSGLRWRVSSNNSGWN